MGTKIKLTFFLLVAVLGAGCGGNEPALTGSENTALEGAQPEVLVDSLLNPFGIRLDDDYIFWMTRDDESLMALAKDGLEPFVLVEHTGHFTSSPTVIALDAGNVYWVDDSNDQIRRIAKAGGEPETLISWSEDIGSIAVDDSWLYWTDMKKVHKVSKSDSEVHTLAEVASPWYLTLDDWSMYFTAGGEEMFTRKIIKVSKLTGATKELIVDAPWSIAVDAFNVYWATGMSISGNDVKSCSKHFGFFAFTRANDVTRTDYVPGIAVDGSHIYFVNEQRGISRVRKFGGLPVELASGDWMAADLALDATHVYWTTESTYSEDGVNQDGTIMRIAK